MHIANLQRLPDKSSDSLCKLKGEGKIYRLARKKAMAVRDVLYICM